MSVAFRSAITCAALMLCSGPIHAAGLTMRTDPAIHRVADAADPYRGVNRHDDAGNDTGDSRIDSLNNAQLDENQPGTNPHPVPPTAGAPMGDGR